MAGFDKSLDKELFSKSVEFGNTKITVAAFSYNNGIPKLQLSRENRSAEGEWTFSKLGRMTKSEVEAVLPLMEEAKNTL
ncbi:MAG TPA: hypothetical protein VJA18_02175 [Candidatus Nanoarchaeia archaeon]|nr:hypothetical protein [Candidatus Nanoarchaeia archaeon]